MWQPTARVCCHNSCINVQANSRVCNDHPAEHDGEQIAIQQITDLHVLPELGALEVIQTVAIDVIHLVHPSISAT